MRSTILFYRVTEPYGCFSNFSSHAIFLGGTMWPTTEHYFQAGKFLDGKYQVEIQIAKSPMIAAELGRSRSHPIRDDWEQIKDDVMRAAIRAKVMQHAAVRSTLLGTRDAEIIEHTENDSYWADGGDGSGKNRLGQIWMEIRDELTRNGPFDELAGHLQPPWLQHPEIGRDSIGWRMGYGEDYLMKWSPWFGGLSAEGRLNYQSKYPEPDDWKGYYDE